MKTAVLLFLSLFLFGLSARADVGLAWDASTSTNVTGYNVYRGDSEATLQKITPAPIAATTFRDTGCPIGATCFYAVTAIGTATDGSTVESVKSNVVSGVSSGLSVSFVSPSSAVPLGTTVPLTIKATSALVATIYINGIVFTTWRSAPNISNGELTFNWKPAKRGTYTIKGAAQDTTTTRTAQITISVK